MNHHKYDIAHFPDTFTNVSEHFNSAGHSIQDFSKVFKRNYLDACFRYSFS